MCHIISRGVYDIFVQKDGVSVCVGKYDNKGSFGELALMYNTPRAATIVATQEGALWGLVSLTKDDDAQFFSANYRQLKSSFFSFRIEPHFTD